MGIFITLSVLIILVSIALIGIVLIQKSKGGGLASSFAGANQVFGVRRANTGVEKFTWILIGAMWVLCVCATFALPKEGNQADMRVKDAPVETQQLPAGDFNTPVPAADAAE